MITKNRKKSQLNYCCSTCDYNTGNKYDYNKHLLTAKHTMITNDNKKSQKIAKEFKCVCGKEYANGQNLCRHKKNCTKASNKNDLVIELLKENKELKNMIIDQTKNTTQIIDKLVSNPPNNTMTNSMNHTNNNSNNNNNFNINVFLNDKCKDAINFSDFIENVEVTNGHLENNARHGFVKGITQIIMDGLKDLSIFERPIHCSDVKREVMYIKDDDKWEKETDNKKLCDAIQEITRKSLLQFQQWKEENPECNDLDSESGTKYMAIHSNSMAGSKREEFYPKIIKAVAKETVIDRKECL